MSFVQQAVLKKYPIDLYVKDVGYHVLSWSVLYSYRQKFVPCMS